MVTQTDRNLTIRATGPIPKSARSGWPHLVVAVLLALTACTSTTAPSVTSTPPAPGPHTSSPSAPAPGPPAALKVLMIIEENRSVPDVAAHMPYLTAQGERYGTATDFHALAHPSLPNYLAITGGSTFGVQDDDDPAAHPLREHSVFATLAAAGRSVKTYAEAMPSNCTLRNAGRYAVRHNPWTYYADPTERALCARLDVPLGEPGHGALSRDVTNGTLPDFALAIPDICDDGHDCSAQTADDWLRRWLPVVESGVDFRAGRLAVIVTWDEDDGRHGNHIPLMVLHPALDHRRATTRLDHDDLSATISALGPVAPLKQARGGTDLLREFGLR